VPEPTVPEPMTDDPIPEPTTETRLAEHAAIDRLAADLLPALVAKLGATGLGEIEVREGPWRVRLRRPADARTQARRGDRPSRGQASHTGHGRAPATIDGSRSARTVAGTSHSGNGSTPAGSEPPAIRQDPHRAVATSPAVGLYRPRPDLPVGSRVRGGDRLGTVDMLGIPQPVVAPVDGILGGSLAESGDAVEYGQELVVIELAGPAER